MKILKFARFAKAPAKRMTGNIILTGKGMWAIFMVRLRFFGAPARC
jgi:hypothetical protein